MRPLVPTVVWTLQKCCGHSVAAGQRSASQAGQQQEQRQYEQVAAVESVHDRREGSAA